MIFTETDTRLADSDLPRIGHGIGVGEDELHAFLEVETSGGGFDASGRPKMLFEPHRFYANLSGAKRALAVKGGLAYPTWGTKPYPKDSYPRLVAAITIDETAALRSASWGIGQIMGENHVTTGYDSPQAMVAASSTGGRAARGGGPLHHSEPPRRRIARLTDGPPSRAAMTARNTPRAPSGRALAA